MATRVPHASAAKLPGIEVGEISNFSGGENLRDSSTELAANEVYSAWNVSFDQRGGVQSRLGYVKRNLSTLGSGVKIVQDYFSPLLGVFLTQAGSGLYLNNGTSVVHTFTTSDCLTFAELGGKVIASHPVDGLWWSTDGSTWTHITSANAPTTGTNYIETWESKLFVGMSDGTVRWSAASDPLTWNANDFNAIWTKDQRPIVSLHIGSGQDIQGRPGLLVFKQDSVYRINDAATGAYTVLDTSYGAAGPKAVVGVGARVIWIGKGGIFWWREDQASPVAGADLLRPLWRSSELSFGNQAGWAAGRRLNRAYFSISSSNATTNDIAIEYEPDDGWLTLRNDAMTCYSVDSTAETYGGSPTANGQVYHLDTGGTDDGAAISGYFQSRWIVPNGGYKAQLWKLRCQGRGNGTMTIRTDYQDSGGQSRSLTLSTSTGTWGSFAWGDGTLWQSPALSLTQEFSGFGSCRSFSVRFDFTSSTTTTGRTLFGNIPAPTVGGFAIYSFEYLFIPLGLS